MLSRPLAERCREYRYRFAQCVIFGLPVLALQWFGPMLSARADEAARWVPLLQAVLTGWICYIGALPMLVEGLIQVREKLRPELVLSSAAVGAYLYSVAVLAYALLHGHPGYRPLLFHLVVLVLVAWNGLNWWIMRRLSRPE